MTLTIDLTPETEARLKEEAERAGLPMQELAGRLLVERLRPPSDRITQIIAEISKPIDIEDVSREAIYAE